MSFPSGDRRGGEGDRSPCTYSSLGKCEEKWPTLKGPDEPEVTILLEPGAVGRAYATLQVCGCLLAMEEGEGGMY